MKKTEKRGEKNAMQVTFDPVSMEVHDLAISKYVAGREKDREFTRELARHGMTGRKTLLKRLAVTKLDPAVLKLITNRIKKDFPQPPRKR